MNHRFAAGDSVVYTNDFGVCWGIKVIGELDERSGEPTYHFTETDTPWYSVSERCLSPADAEDLLHLDIDQHWDYFQKKHGFELLPEEMGGCY